jgi:hypothetical protein
MPNIITGTVLYLIVSNNLFMKHVWESLIGEIGDRQETAYTRKTILMVLLFLTFFGASFYVMIESLFS